MTRKYNSAGRKGKINLESEILKLYDSGKPIKMICAELGICNSTAHNHLQRNNRRRNRKHQFNAVSFSTFTPESCYWAGFIAADGGISNIGTGLRLELGQKDAGHLSKLLKYVEDKDPYIVSGTKECVFDGKIYQVKFCRADVNSVEIIKDLKDNFNITHAKSLTIKPPTKIPNELIQHYIRGYFDGDGSICWSKTHKCAIFSICSGSDDLLQWIADNIKEQVDYDFAPKALTARGKVIGYIRQPWQGAKCIFTWMYKDSTPETRLDRKHTRYLKYGANHA